MPVDVSVRPTSEDDRAEVLRVVREAFSGEVGDGPEEVGIVEAVWSLGASLAAGDLVAIAGGEIVGHVWHHSESSTDLPYPASPRWQSDPTGRAGALALLS